ncbi:DNA primase [Candidatus Phytoplasma oryzae]|nr:DNA primase [Candidatus Phytoplasma oryzae]
MNKNVVREINQKISILELVVKCGINLKKTGKNFMALCPFHNEKTPSFSVSPEKNIALCMSCLKGGNPLKFYQEFKKISISDAIVELSQKFNLKISSINKITYFNPLYQILEDTHIYYRNSLKSFFRHDIQYDFIDNPKKYESIDLKDIFRKGIEHPFLYSYLEERELNLKIIEEFQLGFADSHNNSLTEYLLEFQKYDLKKIIKLGLIKTKEDISEQYYYDFFRNRIIFPLTNEQGKIVGFVGRSIQKDKQNKIKYLFNMETIFFKKSSLLYRFFEHYEFMKEKNEIILCEGFFDVIAFFKINKKNVVATMGTQLTKQQINLLKKITCNILVAYDGDLAGKESALKVSQILNDNGFKVRIIFFPLNMDPDQYIHYHIKNSLDFDDFIRNNVEDFIFYTIEKKIKKKIIDNNKIEKEILNLLKHHNQLNQEYYQKEIYIRYQIYINLNNLDFFYKKNFVSNNFFYIKQKINNSIKNNISAIEVNIINDIFLNKEYIDFIKDDIIHYISNTFILDIIDKVKEYYDVYASNDELINGINIENFIKVYNIFLNKLSNYFSVYDLLLEIRQSFVFKKKKRIENKEDLKIFYFQLKINNIFQEIEEIKKKRDNIIHEKNSLESSLSLLNKTQFKEFMNNIKLKDQKIQKKREEIEKIKEKIRLYHRFKNIK